mgnify:CR=1 FL=1
MKRLTILTMMLAISLSSFSMSISKSRRYSLFLTDKMAYELDLTNEQFEAVYEINFDYFRSIYRQSDIDLYWPVRDENLYYVLDDYQYAVYCVVDYFYDPVYYLNSRWSLGVYSFYTDRSYYYRSYPITYHTYRGAHMYAPSYYMSTTYMKPIHHDNMHPSATPRPDQMNNGRFANRGARTSVSRGTGGNNGNFVNNDNKNGKSNNAGQDDTYSVGRPTVTNSNASSGSNRPTNINSRPTTNNSSSTSSTPSTSGRSNSSSRSQTGNTSNPSNQSRSTGVSSGRNNSSSSSSSSRSSSVSSGRSNSNSSSSSSRSSSVSSGRSNSSSSSSSRSSSVSSGRSSSSSSGTSGRGGRR